MQNILHIAYNVMLPVFAIIGLAALSGRWFSFDLRLLSRMIIYVFTPFLVLQSLAQSNFRSEEVSVIAAMALFSSLVILAIAWGVARLMKYSGKLESGFILSVLISNAGFLGFPVVEFGFGKEALPYAALFFALANIITNSIGVYLASRGSMSIRQSLKNVFLMPLIYSALLGLLLNYYNVQIPLPLERVISLLSQATVPCALMLLGFQLSRMEIKGKVAPVLTATAVRLLISPLVAFGLAYLLGMNGLPRQATITQISMPTALFAAVFATEFGSDADYVTAVILISTLCSIVTLSILLSFLV